MQIITFIIMTKIATYARSISRKSQNQKPVQLYAYAGRHLTIFGSGRVSSTWSTTSPYAQVQLVPVGTGEFVIQGELTGLYISVPKTPRPNATLRLKGVMEKENATRFSEELIRENYFNKYFVKNDKNCTLVMKKSGKVGILCTKYDTKRRNVNQAAFLPRKVHTPAHYRGSHY